MKVMLLDGKFIFCDDVEYSGSAGSGDEGGEDSGVGVRVCAAGYSDAEVGRLFLPSRLSTCEALGVGRVVDGNEGSVPKACRGVSVGAFDE